MLGYDQPYEIISPNVDAFSSSVPFSSGINQVSWLDDFIQELLAVPPDEEGDLAHTAKTCLL